MSVKKKVFSIALMIMLVLTVAPVNSMAASQDSDSNAGKVTIITDGLEKSIDFSKCITIYDENGNIVNLIRPDYVRPGGSFTLQNGWSASCNPVPLAYFGTKITMSASCSAGNVSSLGGEAQLWDSPSSTPEIIGKFKATSGTWYGSCKGYLSHQDDYLFIVRNLGSDPVTIDSLTINF